MNSDQDKKPLARKRCLVVKEVSNEVLIYDQERDRAHCLNETAALVWKYCDGKRDAKSIASLMERDLNTFVDEKVVWYAISQLSKDHLMEERTSVVAGMNRRELIRTLGVAAVVAVPVVTSIVAPTPAQAATCTPQGGSCVDGTTCCSGACPDGTCL